MNSEDRNCGPLSVVMAGTRPQPLKELVKGTRLRETSGSRSSICPKALRHHKLLNSLGQCCRNDKVLWRPCCFPAGSKTDRQVNDVTTLVLDMEGEPVQCCQSVTHWKLEEAHHIYSTLPTQTDCSRIIVFASQIQHRDSEAPRYTAQVCHAGPNVVDRCLRVMRTTLVWQWKGKLGQSNTTSQSGSVSGSYHRSDRAVWSPSSMMGEKTVPTPPLLGRPLGPSHLNCSSQVNSIHSIGVGQMFNSVFLRAAGVELRGHWLCC